MKLLFVTWDAPRISYFESLFLPIFVGLQKEGVHTDVLQFRWGDEEQRARIVEACADFGMGYQSARVWRRPTRMSGTVLSAVAGASTVRSAIRRFQPELIMPRSIFAALSTLLAGAHRVAPIVYDADGLEADIRVEQGSLRTTGAAYRVMRDIEAQIVRRSVAVLGRSAFNCEVLKARAGPLAQGERFHIVSNGRDENVFVRSAQVERNRLKSELGFNPSDPVVAFVGSVSGQYKAEDIALFTRALRKLRPDTRLLVVTPMVEEARRRLAVGDAGVAADAIVMSAPAPDIPRYLSIADVGLSLFHVGYSTLASAPVKLGEYLLCGVPTVGTGEIGDTKRATEAGVFFDESAGLAEAAQWVVEHVLPNRDEMSAIARAVGLEVFSLPHSVETYARALRSAEAAAKSVA